MRRVVVAPPAIATCQHTQRFASNDDRYVNKVAKKKLQEQDDPHWLEAEIDENINTPEERYAHAREVENLRRMVKALCSEQGNKLEDAVREREDQIKDLKAQMSSLESRLSELTKK